METVYVPETKHPRIVLIGGGFAGINFAKQLKNKEYQLIVLDQNNFHQFPPLFYQVATSGLEPDSISFSLRKIFRNAKNVFFRMAEVVEIESDKNLIKTDIGQFFYDYLVVATGTTNNYYGLDNVEEHALALKTIQESLDIRSKVLQSLEEATHTNELEERKRLTNIVICGGGPAGVELAGAFAEFKAYIFNKDYKELSPDLLQIFLVEATDELLSTMSEKSSADAKQVLEKLGVEVMINTAVEDYDGKAVKLSNGEEIETTNLIWAAGVKGNLFNGLMKDSIVKGQRLKVDRQLRVKGYDNIFAIGDIALMQEDGWEDGHPQVAPAAIQHGDFLGKLFRDDFPADSKFSYFDKGQLATVGMKNAVLDKGKLHLHGFLGWFVWATVHLFSISGFKNRLRVGVNWMISYLSYEKRNRLIIRKYSSKRKS